MKKKNYLKLFKGILEATYKGISEVCKTSKIYTFSYTFLESIYDQLQAYNAEERSGIIEFIQSSTSEEISKMLEDTGEHQSERKTTLADLVKILGYSTAKLENLDSKIASHDKKIQFFETMLSQLNERSSELTCDRAILIELLNEILKYTKTDPSSHLFIPPSLKAKDKPTIRELLHYSSQWTSLVGRKTEEEELEKFSESDKQFIWWGIQGPGGSGKSRLALEWVLKLSKKGWKAGFIAGENLKKFIDTEDWRPLRPTAIVVDYGHEKSEIIPKFVEKYYRQIQDLKFPPLRLLVLDRASSRESWWMTSMSLASEKDQICLALACYKSFVKNQNGLEIKEERMSDILELKPIESGDFQTEIIRNVIIKYKNDDKTTVIPSCKEIAALANHFADGRPLYLSMVGIAIAEKGIENLQGWNYETLLDHIIKREIDIWKNYTGLGNNIDSFISDVAFITLCNGLPFKDFENFLAQYHPELSRSKNYKDKLINLLGVGNDEKIQPLVPDVLGGIFLLSGGAPKEKVKYFDCSAYIAEALDVSPDGIGQTILRSLQDFDQLDIISNWLDIAFAKIPDDYVDMIYHGFLSAVSICIIIGVKRGYKLENLIWFKRYKSLAFKNQHLARLITLLTIDIFRILGMEKRWAELEDWGKGIEAIRSDPLFKDDREIAFAEVKAAVNATIHYGSAQKWDDFERWGEKIKVLRALPEFKTDREIALAEVEAAANAIIHYGSAKEWDRLEIWGDRIKAIRSDPLFKKDREIALEEAQAAFNAISSYGSAQNWDGLEKWGDRIMVVRSDHLFEGDREIALAETKAAVNAISCYGSAQNWDWLEKWGDRIKAIRSNPLLKEDREIAFVEATATINAIGRYGSAQNWDGLEKWGDRIIALRSDPLFKDDRKIAIEEVKAAINAVGHYGSAQNWDWLEKWGDRIKALRNNHLLKDDLEIALAEAKVAFNAISSYGSAQKWVELEGWGERIRTIRLDDKFKNDREIALHEVNAAFNVINHYGPVQKWVELEKWGETIRTIRLDPLFKYDREIALVAAEAAFIAIFYYNKEEKITESCVWKDRAFSLYEDFPFDPEIIINCVESIAVHFLKVPDNLLGELLIDIAGHAPWIKSPKIPDIPFGISIPNLISKIKVISDNLYRKAKKLEKQTKEVIKFCEQYPNYASLSIIFARQLWQNRMFLDNWGKDLWREIIKAGNAEWLREALDDPWNSPEDRELLEKLLKEHTGNKE